MNPLTTFNLPGEDSSPEKLAAIEQWIAKVAKMKA